MIYLVIFTFIGFITGFIISSKYKYRYEIYKKTRCFFEFYKLKISYSQIKIIDIVDEFFSSKEQNIKNCLINYYTSKKANDALIIDSFKSLYESDYKDIISKFSSLGKFGRDEEIEHTNNLIQAVKVKEEEYLLSYKKNSKLYIQLCTLIGLIIGILLL